MVRSTTKVVRRGNMAPNRMREQRSGPQRDRGSIKAKPPSPDLSRHARSKEGSRLPAAQSKEVGCSPVRSGRGGVVRPHSLPAPAADRVEGDISLLHGTADRAVAAYLRSSADLEAPCCGDQQRSPARASWPWSSSPLRAELRPPGPVPRRAASAPGRGCLHRAGPSRADSSGRMWLGRERRET
jgi:hypothetical protein